MHGFLICGSIYGAVDWKTGVFRVEHGNSCPFALSVLN